MKPLVANYTIQNRHCRRYHPHTATVREVTERENQSSAVYLT